jgi:hypothetical protein
MTLYGFVLLTGTSANGCKSYPAAKNGQWLSTLLKYRSLGFHWCHMSLVSDIYFAFLK